jgi:glutamate synthase domain-containing protein 3
VARNLLSRWERGAREQFVKVMPRDYKRALQQQAEMAAATADPAVVAAADATGGTNG